jgi:NTE family protein
MISRLYRSVLVFSLLQLLLAACVTRPEVGGSPPAVVLPPPVAPKPPKVALVLGGGAVRGFAHVGVIKVLEAQGIVPEMVAGTSAGSVVGALYAGGYNGFELQKVAFQLDEAAVGDWVMPNRGFLKGEQLQNFINKAVQNRPIEKLGKPFAAVATDLQTGEQIVFRRGNTGMAVRASSSVPGLFQPVGINGREYVDGGLVSPVPVRAARAMGADVVIAVDISSKPKYQKVNDFVDMLLQTFSIMGQAISTYEMAEADIVIRPNLAAVGASDFEKKHLAILEGEKAAQAALPLIRRRIQEYYSQGKESAAPR